MKHTQIPLPPTLHPGDSLTLDHYVEISNNTKERATLIGWRWEPVWASDLSSAAVEQLEAGAVDEVRA